jgi:hypothetical protein
MLPLPSAECVAYYFGRPETRPKGETSFTSWPLWDDVLECKN